MTRDKPHTGQVERERGHLYWGLASIGFALMLAPALFVTGNILEYELGLVGVMAPLDALLADPARKELFDLASPFVFLGGMFGALVINLYPVVRLNLSRHEGTLVGTLTVRNRPWNLAVVAVGGLMLLTMLTYLVVENH